MMRKILALAFSLCACAAQAQTIIGALPFTLQNGSIADANQVMADFNAIVASVNANAANAGANSNITALNNLTTPLVYTSGGASNYIGGTSGGSANAQTIASPIPSGFTLVTGKSVTFLVGPALTNTGPAQLNVAATGLTNVFKQGASGPVALSGGELTAGNLVTATFDGTQYQISNQAPQSQVAPCTSIDWGGAAPPSGYLLENGAAASRTTFVALFSCITVQGVAATTTSGSGSVVVPNSALFQIGWSVGGSNVTCNTTINGIPDGTHITTVAASGATGATTLTIGPYPQGDCSTTFNLPSFAGRATVMRDAAGATLTATTCTNPASIGTTCGTQTTTLSMGNLPAAPPTGTITNGAINFVNQLVQFTGANNVGGGGVLNLQLAPQPGSITQNTSTFTGNNLGTAIPVNTMQPTALVDKYIKF